MSIKQISTGILAALLLCQGSAVPLEGRADTCSSGIYAELLPILSRYPAAQSYCTANFPLTCTSKIQKRAPVTSVMTKSTTTTTISTQSNVGITSTTKSNAAITTSKTTLTTKAMTTTSSSRTTTVDALSSALSKIRQQQQGVIKAMCSCMQAPNKPACSSKTTSTSIKSSSTTTTSSSRLSTTSTSSSSKSTSTSITSFSSTSSSSSTSTKSTTSTTTTTSTTSSTTTTTSSSPTPSLTCGAEGTPVVAPADSSYATNGDGSAGCLNNVCTASGCQAFCRASKNAPAGFSINSFSYIQGQLCECYLPTGDANQPSTTSNQYFYDIDCPIS